jgi:hypothetical protein
MYEYKFALSSSFSCHLMRAFLLDNIFCLVCLMLIEFILYLSYRRSFKFKSQHLILVL